MSHVKQHVCLCFLYSALACYIGAHPWYIISVSVDWFLVCCIVMAMLHMDTVLNLYFEDK